MNFSIGQSVSLKYEIRPGEFLTYSGIVMKGHKHVRPDELALSTDIPDFPMRVLQKKQIVGFKSEKVSGFRSFKVKSKNKVYQVIYNTGKLSCSCVGFGFRNYCKHTVAVEQHIAKNNG